MPYAVFVPAFSRGKMAENTRELCDLQRIPDETKVPVTHFTICADGTEAKFEVGPGRYKTAVLLFHLMAGSPNNAPGFWLTEVMQRETVDLFYDPPTLSSPPCPGSDESMRPLLLKKTVWIELELKPGYEKHLAAFRTFEEIIEHAWQRRDAIGQDSPEPLLRGAITWAFNEAESPMPDKITISDEMAGKVLALHQRLSQPAHS